MDKHNEENRFEYGQSEIKYFKYKIDNEIDLIRTNGKKKEKKYHP
jgi:hypothetical protein